MLGAEMRHSRQSASVLKPITPDRGVSLSSKLTHCTKQLGAGVGAAAAATGLGASPAIVLGGAAVGGALGVLAHVATARPEVLTADNVPSEVVPQNPTASP